MPDRLELSPLGTWYSGLNAHRAPGSFRHFTRGRYALGEAYRLSGVGPDGALLAPAYHCVTMLDPALALGADVQLYSLKANLSPDLERLDHILTAYNKPVTALLATHFFGLAQDFNCLKQWCEKHHIALIEDCSHVMFTESFQSVGTGGFGRFVAASPYKFFPCEDGGLLYSPESHLLDSIRTKSPSLIDELRSLKRFINKNRTATMTPEIALIDEELEAISLRSILAAEQQITDYSEPSSMYSMARARTTALHSSRFIVGSTFIEDNIKRRRNNYRRWTKAVAPLPNCHAPFPDLPENCTPYMFPLHIDHPDPHFYWLKHLGVPVWRWDEMAVSGCTVAHDYRLHLLHLPCHQSLTGEQMDWIITALQKTMRIPAQGTVE